MLGQYFICTQPRKCILSPSCNYLCSALLSPFFAIPHYNLIPPRLEFWMLQYTLRTQIININGFCSHVQIIYAVLFCFPFFAIPHYNLIPPRLEFWTQNSLTLYNLVHCLLQYPPHTPSTSTHFVRILQSVMTDCCCSCFLILPFLLSTPSESRSMKIAYTAYCQPKKRYLVAIQNIFSWHFGRNKFQNRCCDSKVVSWKHCA